MTDEREIEPERKQAERKQARAQASPSAPLLAQLEAAADFVPAAKR